MKKKIYTLGWEQEMKMIIDKEKCMLTCKDECSDDVLSVICDRNFTMTLLKNNQISECTDGNNIRKIPVNEDGSRWEGPCSKDLIPCGYGSLFNEDGDLIYKGFMLEKAKVGFGMEYFSSTRTIDYEGTFISGYRHGYGITKDMHGNVLFEGQWAFGQKAPFYVTVENNSEDNSIIHNCISSLIIGNNCFNSIKKVDLDYYDELTLLKMGDHCFQNATVFRICYCNNIKHLEIGDNCFSKTEKEGSCIITGCENLEDISIGHSSFRNYTSAFQLTSHSHFIIFKS